MSPASGRSRPASRRRSVDLPAPLGPTTPSTSPGATVRETPARIAAAPCALCRFWAMSVPAMYAAYEQSLDECLTEAVGLLLDVALRLVYRRTNNERKVGHLASRIHG